MRRHKLTLWALVDEETPAVEKCWKPMAQLGLGYQDIEKVLADIPPGSPVWEPSVRQTATSLPGTDLSQRQEAIPVPKDFS
jgi:hypothetical protein